MSLKRVLVNVQRLFLIGLEALIVIVSLQMVWAFFSGEGHPFIQHAYVFSLMMISAFPLFFMHEKSHERIWIGTMAVLWIVIGIAVGYKWYVVWIPTVFGLWRSLSSIMVSDYILQSIFKRDIMLGIITGAYVYGSYFSGNDMWSGTSTVGWMMFIFTLGAMMASWMSDLAENRGFRWTQVIKSQGLTVLMIVVGIILFVSSIAYFTAGANSATFGIGRIAYILLYPLAKLMELILPLLGHLAEMIAGKSEGMIKPFEPIPYTEQETNPPFFFQIIKWFFILLLFGTVVFVVYLLIRRFFGGKGDFLDNRHLVETRLADSVIEDDQKQSFLRRLWQRFNGDEKDEVRLQYRKFLSKYEKLSKSETISTSTPREVLHAAAYMSANEDDLTTLTTLYEERRYGKKDVDSGIIRRMKDAVQRWYRDIPKN